MTELDLLNIFYDELRAQGEKRDALFLDIDETFAAKALQQFGQVVPIEDLQKLADICIANEWLERTTADVEYKFLSLTNAGLQVAISQQYQTGPAKVKIE